MHARKSQIQHVLVHTECKKSTAHKILSFFFSMWSALPASSAL
uniref:Uncharacterized protein n=1 Tax=Anguilla anguilla TaxID=7936 RepID=A0A0E9UYE3_ANGAN